MPLSKRKLHHRKSRTDELKLSPQKVPVEFIERCKICDSAAHLYKLDGWYYACCYHNKLHRGQMFRTSMEALTDWNQYNEI